MIVGGCTARQGRIGTCICSFPRGAETQPYQSRSLNYTAAQNVFALL